MNVGQRIKLKREEIGMSAEILGEKIGKSRATVYRYENGDIENMPYSVLVPIANALCTTPSYLLGYDEEEKPTKALETLVGSLSDEECDEVIKFVQFLVSKRKQ